MKRTALVFVTTIVCACCFAQDCCKADAAKNTDDAFLAEAHKMMMMSEGKQGGEGCACCDSAKKTKVAAKKATRVAKRTATKTRTR